MAEQNENHLFEKEVFKLIKDIVGLKTTIDISFKNFEETLSGVSSLVDSLGNQLSVNTSDTKELKENINSLKKEQLAIKKDLEQKIATIEGKLKTFAKKINWKEISKWAIIISTIIGAITTISMNLAKLKKIFLSIFK